MTKDIGICPMNPWKYDKPLLWGINADRMGIYLTILDYLDLTAEIHRDNC